MKIKDLIATSPKWEHPDPGVRLEAVAQLQIEDSILLRLIAADEDDQVRSAAVAKLTASNELCRLMEGDIATLASAARQRFQEILDAAADIEPHLQQIAVLNDTEMLRQIAVSADSLELKQASVDRLIDEGALAEIAVEANQSAIRQAAVLKISAEQALATVLRDSLGKDKNVYKIAKEKLAEIHSIEEDKQGLLQECEQLVEAITQHARSLLNPSFERKWRSLVSNWQQLETGFDSILEVADKQTLESLQHAFASANQQCEEIVDQINTQKVKSELQESAVLAVCDLLDEKLLSLSGGELSHEATTHEEPAGDVSTDGTAGGAPADEKPADVASVDGMTAGEAPADEEPADVGSVDGTIAREAPFGEMLAPEERADGEQAGETATDGEPAGEALVGEELVGEDLVGEALPEKGLTEKKPAVNGSPLETLAQFQADIDSRWRTLQYAAIPEPVKARFFGAHSKLDTIVAANSKWEARKQELERLLTGAKSAATPEPNARKELHRVLNALRWPDIAQPPEQIQTARLELARLDQLQKNRVERENQSKTELTSKLDQLDEAIESGSLKKADKLLKEAQHILTTISAATFQQDRIGKLTIKIRELRDWQGYATTPKREELCDRMEALLLKELHPRDKADHIKSLQDEWKSLGASHSYRSQKLWHRFRQAADKAYEPCQAYFKEQEKHRQQNLKERKVICTHLETFLDQTDWDNVNWKAVADIIQAAKKEWHRFENINRSKRKSIQNRFFKVLDQLQAKLHAEQNTNRDKKKALIDEIKLLTDESVDLTTAINRTKEFQKDWKKVGVTQLRADQSLWKEFRSYCDQVFERRSEKIQSGKNQEQALQKEAEVLCQDLESAAGNATQSASLDAISKGKLNQAKRSFDSLDLPHRSRTSLRERFDRACNAYEGALKQQKVGQRLAINAELRRRANLCCILESKPSQADADAAEQAWQSDTRQELPPELEERIAQRWKSAHTIAGMSPAGLNEIQQTNLKEAQLLCVRMELLAGMDSPEEAQPIRMEYQVSRLNKEFSRREKETRSPSEQKKSMELDWYCLGPLPSDAIADLNQRFESAAGKFGGER